MRFFCFIFLFIASVSAETEEDYIQSLIARSSKEKLYQDRFWHLILHYKKTRSGTVSESNSTSFFISAEGRTDPEKEMHSVLRSFFSMEKPTGLDEMHPQCRFPARYRWLKEKLNFDPAFISDQKCERFETWKSALNPKGIKVIFASYYMGAPASVYGHTLMKIDTAREENRELLDYGVNYAASQDAEDNPVQYAFKGIFGLYNGQFSIFPYYFKVNEYNEGESRDLWEYRLNLNEEEIEWFHLHLWELGSASFPYYFFSDNCSYHLLSLLEVARPSLRLREKLPGWVIPSETIKVISEEKDLVAEKLYRPSLHSRIRQKLFLMSREEREILYKVLGREISPDKFREMNIPDDRKAFLLDALLDSFRFRKANKNQENAEDALYRKFLSVRTELPAEKDTVYSPVTTSPDTGHSIIRIKTGIGYSTKGSFAEFSLRPAHHDLLNQDSGYFPNSENLVLNFRLRAYNEDKRLFLEETNILKLASFTPYNSISKLNSYFVNFGSDAAVIKKDRLLRDPDYRRQSMVNTEALYGFTFQDEYSPSFSQFSLSILAGMKVQSSPLLERGYRAGPQVLFNLIGDFGNIKFLLSTAYYGFSFLTGQNDYKASFQVRYSLNLNNELRAELFSQRYYNEAVFSYSHLF
ncbi:MAG TPA: DUF4105 domain-containing protein [Leptospiraceae bacterium]|nr:DUF4105 domain-containing protein [Leptospiraceae bacterium]HMY66722.1 DUF4105 domain-containing protein [Leptospiraceae bacterium]HNF13990.1 DUF4105 domain-containing protein [Leptospiraceae bacterium]HNF25454.1 DUF4105 domain-containing protein [Leptospiraceae bacterium]HNI97079.1 DUF4105 domain-containing protein [Leptospiraceae bacterium]